MPAGTDRLLEAAEALSRLARVVATVKAQEGQDPKLARALTILRTLSRKESIPMAIVGGLGAMC